MNKQETLEEVALKLYQYKSKNPPYTIITPKAKVEGFINGYKLAQETMYNEEDMEKAFQNGLNRSFDSDFDRWFEKFKKQ